MFFESVDCSPLELPATALKLREEVRAFLSAGITAGSFTPHLGHAEFDAGFTRKPASRGSTTRVVRAPIARRLLGPLK